MNDQTHTQKDSEQTVSAKINADSPSLSTQNQPSQASFSEKYVSVSEKLKRFKPGRIKTVKHYPTGISKLDTVLGGGLYAGLTFLGARPGMGKSTLALQIASEIAAADYPVLFYSLEMPSIRMESKILNRAIHLSDMDTAITSDWLLREENAAPQNAETWNLIEKVEEDISDDYTSLYIKSRKKISFSARDIIQDVERFINEKKCQPVIFVDYLQILSSCSENRNATERQKNDENINALSSLSNKHGLAIFIISSLNRESYRDEQRPLRMDSFKETGSIEYSASVILGLQPRNIRLTGFNYEAEMSKDARELELVFLKQRYGASGMRSSVPLDFYPAKDLYLEIKESADSVPARTVAPQNKPTIQKRKQQISKTNSTKAISGKPRSKPAAPKLTAPASDLPITDSENPALANLQYPDDPRARLAAEFFRKQKEQ